MKTSTPNDVVSWYVSRAKQRYVHKSRYIHGCYLIRVGEVSEKTKQKNSRINVIVVGSLVQTLCETQVVLRIPDLESKFTYPVNCQSPK